MNRRTVLADLAFVVAGSICAPLACRAAEKQHPAWIQASLERAVFKQNEEIVLAMTLFILSEEPIEALITAPGPNYLLHFKTPAGVGPLPQIIPYLASMSRMTPARLGDVYHEGISLTKMFDLKSPGLYSVYAERTLNSQTTLISNEVIFRIVGTRLEP